MAPHPAGAATAARPGRQTRAPTAILYQRVRQIEKLRGAIAPVQKQRSHDFLTTGFYVVAGALIGFGLANLPALSGALLPALNILPAHVT